MARGALKSEGAGRDIQKDVTIPKNWSETRAGQLAAAGAGPTKDIPAEAKPTKSATDAFVAALKSLEQATSSSDLDNALRGTQNSPSAIERAASADASKTIKSAAGDKVLAKALLEKDKEETDGRIKRANDGKLWEGVATEFGQEKFKARIKALETKSRVLGEEIHEMNAQMNTDLVGQALAKRLKDAGFTRAEVAQADKAVGFMESDAPKRSRKGRGADAYVSEGRAGLVVGDSKVLRDYVDKKTKDAEDAGDDSGKIRMSGLDAAKLLQQLGWSQPTSKATQKLIDEHKF